MNEELKFFITLKKSEGIGGGGVRVDVYELLKFL